MKQQYISCKYLQRVNYSWGKDTLMLNGWIKVTQAINLYVLCVKKDEFTATCKVCDKDINVVHMGFGTM